MKKHYILWLVLSAFLVEVNAQIPNAGFEDWTEYGNGFKPVGWWSPNDSLNSTSSYFPITRSLDHYPLDVGSFSIRLENNPNLASGWAQAGIIWPGGWDGNNFPSFPISGHPVRLRGYYKYLPQNGDSMDIHFELYKKGIPVTSGGFYSATTKTEWATFSALVSNTDYPSADSARIMICAFNSDNGPSGIHGNSVLYVDNLSFDDQAGFISEISGRTSFIQISPNPASNTFFLVISRNYHSDIQMNIYNAIGKLVKSEILHQNTRQINVTELGNGIYYLEVKSEDWTEKQKVVIRK